MEAKHTPGKWNVKRIASVIFIAATRGKRKIEICTLCQDDLDDDMEQYEANANLIATSPHLLEDSKSLIDSIDKMQASGAHLTPDVLSMMRRLATTIARAEGRS